jgi:hypothetical protein
MSPPKPIWPYHFQADLIWWDGPFKPLTPHKTRIQKSTSKRKSNQRPEKSGESEVGSYPDSRHMLQ